MILRAVNLTDDKLHRLWIDGDMRHGFHHRNPVLASWQCWNSWSIVRVQAYRSARIEMVRRSILTG